MRTQRHKGLGNHDVGFGWHLNLEPETPGVARAARKVRWVWHNGGTRGSLSFCAFDPERRLALVVLANSSAAKTDEAARKLLALLKP